MTLHSPLDAPARTDLPWLRHRSRPQRSPTASPGTASGSAEAGADDAGLVGAASSTPTPGSTSLDLTAPAASPSTSAPASSPTSAVGSTPNTPSSPLTPSPQPRAPYQPTRAATGATATLNTAAPTLTLTRVQSGVGVLTITAACSDAVADARLGCMYELRTGRSGLVDLSRHLPVAPHDSRRPIILAGEPDFETLTFDLVQCRELRRAAVYLYAPSGAPSDPVGTLVVETFGRARVEIPLEGLAPASVLVALTVFTIDGELVLRVENEPVAGPVRSACEAFGFDTISWLDPQTPLT